MPGGEYLSTGTNQFFDVAPDLARRARALATRGLPAKLAGLSAMVTDDGDLPLELPAEPERNRARRTALVAWTKLVAGARMVGDERLADAAQRASDRQCATGARWPELPTTAGVQNTATHLIVRWSTPTTTGDLNVSGHVPPVGPLLTSSGWPQVLVTKARSLDGRSLELALRPIAAAPGDTVNVSFGELQPGVSYRCESGTVVAAADGTASIDLRVVAGANHLRLEPEVS